MSFSDMGGIIDKPDYQEPSCPLCIENLKRGTDISPIPVSRVIEKLDEYLGRNDYDGAERHLIYWKNEAELGFDRRGLFSVLNELMGLYRKTGKKDEAFSAVAQVIAVIDELGNGESAGAGTAYVNAATVFKAFGEPLKSLGMFERAAKIYERELPPGDSRLGGLYNNFALTLVDLDRFDEALSLYEKALETMKGVENGELEQAITYLNLADLYEKKDGIEAAEPKIDRCLSTAEDLLDKEHLKRDGYYAFVCEKCAPTFLYYGRFAFAAELNKRAKDIYERA